MYLRMRCWVGALGDFQGCAKANFDQLTFERLELRCRLDQIYQMLMALLCAVHMPDNLLYERALV